MRKQALLAFLIFNTLHSYAQTVTIYRGGLATTPVYGTIKEAVAAALTSDSLVMSAHTFTENMIRIDKSLSLTGTVTPAARTIIDATFDSTALIFNNPVPALSKTLLIQDLDITNGFAQHGSIKGGGALYAGPGTMVTLAKEARLHHNEAGAISPLGGAIYSEGMLLIKGRSRIFSNKAATSGGGIFALAGFSLAEDATIDSNTAGISGGGVYFYNNGDLKNSSRISDNNATYGAGLFADYADLSLTGNAVIASNHARYYGGGITLSNSNLTMKDNVLIAANRTDTNYAAAIYAKGNNDISISGGQIIGNHSTHTAAGTGMAVYNDTAAGGSSIVRINSTRVFNPKSGLSRQNEICNVHTASAFISDSCWWGESDTTGLIYNSSSTAVAMRSWVIADWSINGGNPIAGLGSFPVEAYFRLNTGAPLSPGMFWMLQGIYSCDSGVFAPETVMMSSANTISSTYTIPWTSNMVRMLATVDADSFSSSVWVRGLLLHEYINPPAHFTVFPNPGDGNITISTSTNTTDQFVITVYDLLGHRIKESTLDFNNHKSNFSVQAAAGHYIIELKDKNGHSWREQLLIR